jgi:hypothetical protein
MTITFPEPVMRYLTQLAKKLGVSKGAAVVKVLQDRMDGK